MKDNIFTTQDTLNIRLQCALLERKRKQHGITTKKNVFKHSVNIIKNTHGVRI